MRTIWIAVLVLFTGIALAVFMTKDGWSHDAPPTPKLPLGWEYPWNCCSGVDCAPVQSSAIGETSEGYVIKQTGEVIPYRDKKIKDSPDGEYHWCSHISTDHKTICLFVPPPSY